jgi:beta-barrel assembly-enhancing protease
MKNFQSFLLVFGVVLLSLRVAGQSNLPFQEQIPAVAKEKSYMLFDKGEKLSIIGVMSKKTDYTDYGYAAVNSKGLTVFIPSKQRNLLQLEEGTSVIQTWQNFIVENDVLVELLKRGHQYDLRQELHLDAVDYINALNDQGRFFNDAYLEDYLYSLINRIHGGLSNFNKPGNLSIKIARDVQPNAFILPNGTMVISSGLLSTIKSEDELVGILTHEIAHYVLDHHVINYNKALDRKKRAEFWATVATLAAASADAYLSVKNENHIPGVLTAATGIAAAIVSDEIQSRLGIKYSQAQEREADEAAAKILPLLSYHQSGLVVALSRLKGYFIKTGDFLSLSDSGTHPSISSRIATIGVPDDLDPFDQPEYLKKVSLINSDNAWLELWIHNHVSAAKDLVQRNISNHVGTETDYIVLAVINRRVASNKQELEDVLGLLVKAKGLNAHPHIQVYKEEGLTHLRLGNAAEAKKALENYLKLLIEFKTRNGLNDVNNRMKTLEDEIEWTSKMIFKADKL